MFGLRSMTSSQQERFVASPGRARLVLKGGQVEATPGWVPGDDAIARDRKRPPDGKGHSGRCCRKSGHEVTARWRPGDWRAFEETATVACRREHHDRPAKRASPHALPTDRDRRGRCNTTRRRSRNERLLPETR